MHFLHKAKQYIIDFKNEAPWCFWCYLLLTPLGYSLFYSREVVVLSLIAMFIYPFLLKKSRLLNNKYIYFLLIFCFVIVSRIKYFLFQKYLDVYIYHYSEFYSYTYVLLVKAIDVILTAVVIFVFMFLKYKKLTLLQCLCLLFMITASWHGILILYYIFLALLYSS